MNDERMTKEEAIGNLIYAIRWNDTPKKEALEMAIKALKQGSCEDAISRQDAIKEATKEGSYDYISAYKLSKLPPVTPKDDRQNLIDSISKLQTYKLFSGGEKLVELDDVIAILEGR